MNFEKFLYKKINLWILLLTIVLSLIIAIWFGSLVLRSKTAVKIAMIPENLKQIIAGPREEDLSVYRDRFDGEKGFVAYLPSPKNKHLLLSRYDGDLKRSVVELINLNKKEIIHVWKPDIDKINSYSNLPKEWVDLQKDGNLRRYLIYHPLLLKSGDLIIHGNNAPLTKIDLCSKMVWNLDYAFHHAAEIEKDQNSFWIHFNFFPSTVNPGLDEAIGTDFTRFVDNGIMQVSVDGKILFKKSLIQILIDNELEYLIFGGNVAFNQYNPTHLNDIQPVLFDGKFFKKGDLFLSLRALSMIILYRPSENKIIWFKQHPWALQHDVDILNDHQISVYNNKRIRYNFNKSYNKNNNILIYDFEKDKVLNKYETLFKDFNIVTPDEGLSEIQKDGSVFIEESTYGRALQFDKNGNLIWKYINRAKNNKLYRLNWSRIIENIGDELLTKLNSSNCNKS